jgi:formylglycine-generating enzyme required for sulfatase activity
MAMAAMAADNPAKIEWISLRAGSFSMGSDDGPPDERPVHRVDVKAFELAKTLVTIRQYKSCVAAKACTPAHDADGQCLEGGSETSSTNWHPAKPLPPGFRKDDDQPITCVDWEQAKTFAAWAGGRLPTEAEWEYAARGADDGRTYPWGSGKPTCDSAGQAENGRCPDRYPWPVCTKPAGNTPQGICDMAGSVWQWLEDDYHSNYQGAPADGRAWVEPAGTHHAARGGTRHEGIVSLRSSSRDHLTVSPRCHLGFRIARSSSP